MYAHAKEAADVDDRLFDLAILRQDQLLHAADVFVVRVVDCGVLEIVGSQLVIVGRREALALEGGAGRRRGHIRGRGGVGRLGGPAPAIWSVSR